eukprot:928687_1
MDSISPHLNAVTILHCSLAILVIVVLRIIFWVTSPLQLRPAKVGDNRQGFVSSAVPEDLDAIIIGSGIGGLALASLLSKMGKKVLVLEQHSVAGGCTHVFGKKGVPFDTGLHYIGGEFGCKSAPLRRMIDWVTNGGVRFSPLGKHTVYDSGLSHDMAVFGKGSLQERDMFVFEDSEAAQRQMLCRRFPDDVEAIEKYFKLCRSVQANSPIFYIIQFIFPKFLRSICLKLFARKFYSLCDRTATDVLDSITENLELKGVLAYLYGDYGLSPCQVTFKTQADIFLHFTKGAVFPIGGPETLAKAIVPVVE